MPRSRRTSEKMDSICKVGTSQTAYNGKDERGLHFPEISLVMSEAPKGMNSISVSVYCKIPSIQSRLQMYA
jgi:hypothetical protein